MTTPVDDVHSDEGTIHAWLDGALSTDDAERIEAHVAACEACAAVAAEARGLIAGASRVVRMLDAEPAARPLAIASVSAPLAGRGSLWRALRVTPARASIAATLIVALGVVLTRQRIAPDSSRETASTLSSAAAGDSAAAAGATAPPPAAPRQPDSILGSAIAAKLRQEQPVRVMRPTPSVGVVIPSAPNAEPMAQGAAVRVAAARASIAAQRDTMSVAADRARVGFAPSVAAGNVQALERVTEAGRVADGLTSSKTMAKVVNGPVGFSTVRACYRVDSPTRPGTKWGSATLPVVLVFDSTGRTARVLALDGHDTEVRTVAMRADDDSLLLRLRSIGYTGTMQLGTAGEVRSGLLRSAVDRVQLEETVVTSAPAFGDAKDRRAARAPAAAPPVRSLGPVTAAAGTPVSVRTVACPSE